MELAAASEMSPGYRVDKQPTWHPIWRARYRVAVDCHPEVPVPRSTTPSCRGRLARWRPCRQGVPGNAGPTRRDWDRWRDQSGVPPVLPRSCVEACSCAPRRSHRFNNQRSFDHRVSPSYFRRVCTGIRKMTTIVVRNCPAARAGGQNQVRLVIQSVPFLISYGSCGDPISRAHRRQRR